ncbi:MAG: MarR family winged helix-turn-helix transcriptional regulator [Streptococcaceae bacterium]|jgi:DNA-binding MarR family transcriptional regulator|nr:MarR family winged helix-turn-helix transcriptional regulator [Streptococcaceae bacterium]
MDYEEAALFFMQTLKSTNRSKMMGNMNQYSKGENAVLAQLFHHDQEEIAPSDLSKCTHTSTARVASILNSLEEKGFVTREISKEDRRKIIVKITEAGKEEALKNKKIILGNISTIFEKMGKEETEHFLRTFEKFVEHGSTTKGVTNEHE